MSDWELDCINWWGTVLQGDCKHWCNDWDDLPIDEYCSEFASCNCTFGPILTKRADEYRKIRQDENEARNVDANSVLG